MPLQDWCYLFYKNVKRRAFLMMQVSEERIEPRSSSPLLLSSEPVAAASAFELILDWAQYLIEAFHWYLLLFDLDLNLAYLSSKWSVFPIQV